MIFVSYISCGILYFLYSYQKINSNIEQFLHLLEEEMGKEVEIENFFIFLFISSLFAWPFMMANEINNKKDF